MVFYAVMGLVVVAAWTAVVAGTSDADRQTIKAVSRRLTLSLAVGGIAGALATDMSAIGAIAGTLVIYFLDKRFGWSDTPTWSV